MANKIIEIKNVSKSYGDAVIIENLNLYTYENSGDKNDHTESGIYAIEISNMAFFDDMNLEKRYPEERQTMYLALARTSKRPDTAEAFAVEVISTNKE